MIRWRACWRASIVLRCIIAALWWKISVMKPRKFKRAALVLAAQGKVVTEGNEQVRALDPYWPAGVYSLSHVALPFGVDDGLYGAIIQPDYIGSKSVRRLHGRARFV